VVFTGTIATSWQDINENSKCGCDKDSDKKIVSLDKTECVDKCDTANGGGY
jgi:hypothetical protein